MDVAVRAPRLPRPGETLHGDSFALSLGGKGANQAVAACRLGASVRFFGKTGSDGFGAMARERLAAFGLDLRHVATSATSGTGIATIAIDASGQNAITVIAGANADLATADCPGEALTGVPVLLLQCETPDAVGLAAADVVRAGGGTVILDPAPVPPGGIRAYIGHVDLVTPNETEAAALTGLAVTDPESALAAARALVGQGFAAAVVKCGGAGLAYASPAGEGTLPTFTVEVVDTVAAGDCFNAGLGVALAEGRSLGESLHIALACGALAVTRAGAADAAPTRPEVADLLARHRISG